MSIERFATNARMSQAVKAGGFLFISGQVAEGSDSRIQAEKILARIDDFLHKADMDRSNVVSANIWLADIGDFDALNAVWDNWVSPDEAPARACVQSRLAYPQFRVEIAVTAFRSEERS